MGGALALQTLSVSTRREWRAWLEHHFATECEVWLLIPNRASGTVRIPYNDTVEEALCFGWIDSTVRRVDATHSAQRFTPRRAGSGYSQPNRERLKWLMAHDMVHPSLHHTVRRVIAEVFVFPPDIMAALQAEPHAWENWRRFSAAYHRIRVAYVNDARKRPDEFQKRLRNLIKKSAQGRQIGYGGIDKYY